MHLQTIMSKLLILCPLLYYAEAGAKIDAVILSHAGNKVFNMSLTSALRYLPDVATFHIISRGKLITFV